MLRKQNSLSRWGDLSPGLIGLVALSLTLLMGGGRSLPAQEPTVTLTLTGSPTPTVTQTLTRTPTPGATPTPTTTPYPALDASHAGMAYCGGVYSGDTSAGRNNVSSYSCQPWWRETGPELVYRIEIHASQPLTVTLLSADADLDLFLMDDIFPESCVAAGDTFISYQAEPNGYLLVVDGYEGAAGAFRLRLDCPLEEQATLTPTFTSTPRPTATVTLTPSVTPTPRNSYLPSILRLRP